jgi:mRNA interferase HigB
MRRRGRRPSLQAKTRSLLFRLLSVRQKRIQRVMKKPERRNGTNSYSGAPRSTKMGTTTPQPATRFNGQICDGSRLRTPPNTRLSLRYLQASGASCSCSRFGNMLDRGMRVIARSVLVDFWSRHAEANVSLERWHKLVRAAQWVSMDEVQKAAPKAKVLNRERVRFEVAGGNHRLVAAFDFRRQIAFVKFIGTHAEYDRIDAVTVSQF